MLRIEICVGSSCHLKGAHQVVTAFQQEIEQRGLEDSSDLQLVGSFCQGHCTDGVVVKVNDQLFRHVTPKQAADILNGYR